MGRKPTGRPTGRPPGVSAFDRVKRAKLAMVAEAESAVKLIKRAAQVAAEKGNHAPAAWLLEHTSVKDETGQEIRPIASGIDRQTIEAGSRAPTINIGWVIGPTPTQAALPPAPIVLDTEPIED